jgi:hypothetical protein
VEPERGRARPPARPLPGTMAGSDTAPFLSQADDPDDGPVSGTPGLPGSMGIPKSTEPEVPDQEGLQRITGLSSSRSALIVAVLCYINLLNYMDRFTVAGRYRLPGGMETGGREQVPRMGPPRPAHPEFSPPRRPSRHRAVLQHRGQ